MEKMTILFVLTLLGSVVLFGQVNRLDFDELNFELNIHASKRVGEGVYNDLTFGATRENWADSVHVVFSSPEMDVTVSVAPRSSYLSQAWYFDVRVDFKQETFLREFWFTLDNAQNPIHAEFTGVEAIQSREATRNRMIGPYMDKVAELSCGGRSFWIVASGYEGCEGVESIAMNRVMLYNFQSNYFRLFDEDLQRCAIPRDTMYKPAGGSHHWGFLLFTQKPLLLDINRWPGDRKAAFCITNDADGENLPRLKAVFEGSDNPSNPSYYTKGFFARNIPVSTTIHGVNEPALGDMWRLIKSKGNRIGWHTYTMLADPPGTNEQALLHDLVDLEIRNWIDHSVPNNPEDIVYQGLLPESPYFVADIINQSEIEYVWPADTPRTNPFNAYDEACRLPHIVWEATAFTKPVWFYGRTRTEVWEYLNEYMSVSMKYIVTPENLDALIAARGLHVGYTHFCMSQSDTRLSFWMIQPNGDYVVRDDVDEMLQMLDYYRQHRGLWIAPVEDVFDRMLDIEEVKITAVEKMDNEGMFKVTLANGAARDIAELAIQHEDSRYIIPDFAAGSTQAIHLTEGSGSGNVPGIHYQIRYQQGQVSVSKASGECMEPMKVEIFNLKGQRLIEREFGFQQTQIILPFTGKASGIYLARFSRPGMLPVLQKFSVVK